MLEKLDHTKFIACVNYGRVKLVWESHGLGTYLATNVE
jgi:hypothetical protein